MPRLAVVILHYGKIALTARLHQQLLDSDPARREDIFVLDNHAPEVYGPAWLRTEQNLYWPGALELAAQEMGQRGYSHLWFLNNDLLFVSPHPHLERAWKRLERISQSDGPLGIYAPSVTASQYHGHMVSVPGQACRLVNYVDGIAPLISLDALAEVGLDYQGNPYGYGVDVWLSIRLVRAGYTLALDHEVTVRHNYHFTAKTVPGFMDRAARAEDAYLRARLGPDWRRELDLLKQQYIDRDKL